MFKYGSILIIRTLYPRNCKSFAIDAVVTPFPMPERTPPVTKTNFELLLLEANYGSLYLT
jgi:hypothetical protein